MIRSYTYASASAWNNLFYVFCEKASCMSITESIVSDLKTIVERAVLSCHNDAFFLLRHIQTELINFVNSHSCDVLLVTIARKAFVSPLVLYQAFCKDDHDSIDTVLSWISSEHHEDDSSPYEHPIDVSTHIKRAKDVHDLLEPLSFLSEKVCVMPEDDACCTTGVITPIASVPEVTCCPPIPTDKRSSSECRSQKQQKQHKQEKHIKRMLANQLRDSFF